MSWEGGHTRLWSRLVCKDEKGRGACTATRRSPASS